MIIKQILWNLLLRITKNNCTLRNLFLSLKRKPALISSEITIINYLKYYR